MEQILLNTAGTINMSSTLKVTKRNGRLEPLDLDKIHKVATWAAEGLNNVAVSEVELKAHLQCFDGIQTAEIPETLIKAAADLSSEETPDSPHLAAPLTLFLLRTRAAGQSAPPALLDGVKRLVAMERYDRPLLEDSGADEIAAMDASIDHNPDLNFSYAAVKELEGKYLVQNR